MLSFLEASSDNQMVIAVVYIRKGHVRAKSCDILFCGITSSPASRQLLFLAFFTILLHLTNHHCIAT